LQPTKCYFTAPGPPLMQMRHAPPRPEPVPGRGAVAPRPNPPERWSAPSAPVFALDKRDREDLNRYWSVLFPGG